MLIKPQVPSYTPIDFQEEPLPAPRLGIGLITYNRREVLIECVRRVQRFTLAPFDLVIADDGSNDGTVEWARSQGIRVVAGENLGPGLNKNRALYYLLRQTTCDPILLLEDDCWPAYCGWEYSWTEAAVRWHHVNWRRPAWHWYRERYVGSGTPLDPYWSDCITGQATVSSRLALECVGYCDTRLQGFGEEHVEWTHRFRRLLQGFGAWPREVAMKQAPLPGALVPGAPDSGSRLNPRRACAVIDAALLDVDAGTYYDAAQTRRNQVIHRQIVNEPIWRPAWRDAVEKARLFQEIECAIAAPNDKE